MKNYTHSTGTRIVRPGEMEAAIKGRPSWETVSISFLIGIGLAFGFQAALSVSDTPTPIHVEIGEAGITEAQTDSFVVEKQSVTGTAGVAPLADKEIGRRMSEGFSR